MTTEQDLKAAMTDLKLYVWEDVLTDYTSGIMFAMAPDVDTARKIIIGKSGPLSSVVRDLQNEPDEYTSECGFFLYGGG